MNVQGRGGLDEPPVMKMTFPDRLEMSFTGLNAIVSIGIGVGVGQSMVLS